MPSPPRGALERDPTPTIPHREENNGLVVPRARDPTTTPDEPRDSTLVRNRVPAACPTPAWVTPMVNGEGKFRRNPFAAEPTKLWVENRRE